MECRPPLANHTWGEQQLLCFEKNSSSNWSKYMDARCGEYPVGRKIIDKDKVVWRKIAGFGHFACMNSNLKADREKWRVTNWAA
jgi:hypothetical protein